MARLNENRVQRIIEPLITGEGDVDPAADDVTYLRDLGLLAPGLRLRVANPIYREVIPRVLGARSESLITTDPRSFVRDDGGLAFDRLLSEFVTFWKEHGEVLTARGDAQSPGGAPDGGLVKAATIATATGNTAETSRTGR